MTAPDLVEMKFWIVVPQASVNHCENPTLATPEGITYLTADGAGVTIELEETESRWGAYSCKVNTATGVASSVYWDNMPMTDNLNYTFSVYVKGYAGQAMRIVIKTGAGVAKETETFTATGYWQRIEVTHLGTETVTDYQLWVTRDAVASTEPFYVDGFQYEQMSSATTFFHGYMGGFGTGELEYYWQGLKRNSPSVRTSMTRSGGSLLCINDYAKVLSVYGFGMGQFEQLMTPMANGGDYYQQHIRKSRNISFLLAYNGDNQGDMQTNRNIILEACRPDMLEGQPMKLVYQGFDANGNEATHPVEITCVFQPSHVDTPPLPVFQKDTLVFTVPSGLFDGQFEEGTELELNAEFPLEFIAKRDADGNWCQWTGAAYESLIDGLTGIVHCIAEAPNGYIFAGGEFLNAGGDALADYLAMWDGNTWKAVGDDGAGGPAINAVVYTMAFDANGDLYIGGSFINAGGVTNASFIAKISAPTTTPVYSQVGTSLLGVDGGTPYIRAIVIRQSGVIVAGGFIGYIGATVVHNIIYFDVEASADWLELGSGLNAAVYCMKESPAGVLYIGGKFTNADGTYGDYICFWDGAFEPIWQPNADSGIELNNSVVSIDFSSAGNLIIGGLFTNAGGIANADYIVGWNGSSYYALGTGMNAPVYKLLCPSAGGVYAAGEFTIAGGVTLSDRIARWKNGAWQALDIDLPGDGIVYSLLIGSDNSLYLGGDFSTDAEDPDENVVTGVVALNANPTVGNANCYPFMQIHGPGVLQSIINYSTGKQILFDGLTLQTGEWINMWFDPNNLRFESSWRGNIMHYIQAGSDYGNFYLRPNYNNAISVFMPSGTDSNSAGIMFWQPKFWNIEGAKYDA